MDIQVVTTVPTPTVTEPVSFHSPHPIRGVAANNNATKYFIKSITFITLGRHLTENIKCFFFILAMLAAVKATLGFAVNGYSILMIHAVAIHNKQLRLAPRTFID